MASNAKPIRTEERAPVIAHAYPGEPSGNGELTFTFNHRNEYMEVIGAVSIAAGLAAQKRDFEQMTNLLDITTRMWTYARGWQTSNAGESPPLSRTAAAAV